MITYKPPVKFQLNKFSIFLGGSIEMGTCENWQEKITEDLSEHDIIILNPRRTDFDNTQNQSIENEYFKTQVEWELEGLENVNLIIINLIPNTLSPISLLEIGLFTKLSESNNRIIICCPDGFWRKGNIEVICNRYKIQLVESYDELLSIVTTRIINKI